MPTIQIPIERLNNLAKEAVAKVFSSMVRQECPFLKSSRLTEPGSVNLIHGLPISGGFYAVVVSFMGDANGRVMLILPNAAAEQFTLKVLDVPDLGWLEESQEETLQDTLGELGNMLVGLIKGGLTKWYPNLALSTPKVLKNKRLKIETSKQAFRSQYLFDAFGTQVLVDFSYE